MIINRKLLTVFFAAVLFIAIGMISLANSNIPAHQSKIEKVIDNERFFK